VTIKKCEEMVPNEPCERWVGGGGGGGGKDVPMAGENGQRGVRVIRTNGFVNVIQFGRLSRVDMGNHNDPVSLRVSIK